MSGVNVDPDRELLLSEKQSYGTVQSSSDNTKPRLLTVGYSCVVIVHCVWTHHRIYDTYTK